MISKTAWCCILPVALLLSYGSILENEIENLLATIDGRDVRWQRIAPRLEWLGHELEEEIGRVREDRQQDQDDDDGGSQK
ncbi:MAG: hypothetical protein ACE5JU_00320 [Candidatus Binatia bacterium]